jgi:hypothetical protein
MHTDGVICDRYDREIRRSFTPAHQVPREADETHPEPWLQAVPDRDTYTCVGQYGATFCLEFPPGWPLARVLDSFGAMQPEGWEQYEAIEAPEAP